MRITGFLAVSLAALIVVSQAVPALCRTVTQQVSFPAGSDGITISGAIKGDDAVRYILGARAGQRMTVEMTTTNASASFNITAPGATEALHIGSVAGHSFDGILTAGGAYAVEVYLMRNAARRGELAEGEVVRNLGCQMTGTQR